MRQVNPWMWVVLVALCFVAQAIFSRWKLEGGQLIMAVMGVAVAGLWGHAHSSTSVELKKATSQPPPPLPSAEKP